MASMTFKLSEKDCTEVVRDNYTNVYQKMFDQLSARLAQETELPELYRLQGEINMLIQVTHLKEKAQTQLNK